MPKAYWIILLVGIVGALVFAGCKATRAGYESPRYRVISKDGKFEIRDYPALVVAQANMPAAERSQDNGFRRLFKYITGSNSGAEKIAMTTPVLVNDSDRSMSFVLPAKYSLAAAPAPTDSSVELKTLKPARYAVLRFSALEKERSLQRLQRCSANGFHNRI